MGARPTTKSDNMFKIENGIIHGTSYAVKIEEIEFFSWRFNDETGEYWIKFHVPSGKEVRIKVSEEELRDIVDEWANAPLELNIGDENGLDY